MVKKIANKVIRILTGIDFNNEIEKLLTIKNNNESLIASKDLNIKDLESKIIKLSILELERDNLQNQLNKSKESNSELINRINILQSDFDENQTLLDSLTNNYNSEIFAKNSIINELTNKINTTEDQLLLVQSTFEKEKSIHKQEMQSIIDKNHNLTTEKNNLNEKLKYRDQANADLREERDNLKDQLKKYIEETVLQNNKKEEEQLLKQRDDIAKVIIDAGIIHGEKFANEEEEIILNNVTFKFEGLLEVSYDYVSENIKSHNGFIKWIYDAEEGIYYEVSPKFFAQEDFILVELRRRLEDYCTNHQGKPKFVCAICYEPIKLSGIHGERGKVNCFVHSNDNINCPIKTGRNNNIRLFSESHRYLFSTSSYWSKIIRDQLSIFIPQTPQVSNFNIEPIVSYNFNFAVWRKPHFSCDYNGQHLAFEVQTNPSTIKVITSRNLFYRKQNSFILWIFDDSFASSKSLSLKDLFYANNRNIFVFDKFSQEKSEASNQLWLKCIWEEPYIVDKSISWEKKSDYITLDQLTFDTNNYIAYYYPSEAKYINLGGIVSYRVDLNDNSFEDYESTFQDLRKSNLERLKASGVLISEKPTDLIEDNKISNLSTKVTDNQIIDYDISYNDLNGIFICRQNKLWYKVNRATLIGELLPYKSVEEFLGVLKCVGENFCDLISHDGKLIKSLKCENLKLFLDNQIIAYSGHFHGWYNANFEEVLPINYNIISKFSNKFVFVKKDNICSLYYHNGIETSIQNCSSIKVIDDDNLVLYIEKKWKIYSVKADMVIIGPVSDKEVALNELKYLNRKVSEKLINKQTFLYGTITADKGDYFDVNLISISGMAKLNKTDVTYGTIKKYKDLLNKNEPAICKVILLETKDEIAIVSQKIAKEKSIKMVELALKNIGKREYLQIIGTRNQNYYTITNEKYYGTISKNKLGDNAIGKTISARIKEVFNSKTIAFELVEII